MAESEQELAPAVNRLWKLAKHKKYDELETEWLLVAENHPHESDGMLRVIELLARREEADQAESLVFYLLSEQTERLGVQTALETIAKAAALLPDSSVLRDEAVSAYRQVHASYPSIEAVTDMTVGRDDVSLAESIEQLDALLAFRPGTYVLDGKCVGRVEGIDLDAMALSVSFEDGEKACALEEIADLKVLEEDDLRGLALFEREKLERLATEEPCELVVLALKTFGRELAYRDLRQHLKDVVPSGNWSKWWGAAKTELKRFPLIDMSDSNQPTMRLRGKALAYEDRMRMAFADAESVDGKAQAVLDYLSNAGEKADAELLTHFAEKLREHVSGDGTDAVISRAVLEEIRSRGVGGEADGTGGLPELADASLLLAPVDSDAVASCMLAFIRKAAPETWPRLYADMLPDALPEACDRIAASLIEANESALLADAAGAIQSQPDRHTRALAWLWRAICGRQYREAFSGVDRLVLILNLLRAARSLHRNTDLGSPKERKDLLSHVRNALSLKNYSFVRDVVEHADPERAEEVWNASQANSGLSSQAQSEFFHIVHESHAEHFEEEVDPWEEDAVYTTGAGLQKRREEHAHLVDVQLSEAEKAIGKAAAFGDLSENSEYTAAIEQRDRLAMKAGMMQQELAKAKVIDPNGLTADRVTVGSRVEAKNLESGEVEAFTFLGPWDVDVENGVYSYLAPLSLAFMGETPGSTVSFSTDGGERTWEIVSISAGV